MQAAFVSSLFLASLKTALTKKEISYFVQRFITIRCRAKIYPNTSISANIGYVGLDTKTIHTYSIRYSSAND
jgi:hypothetical protein